MVLEGLEAGTVLGFLAGMAIVAIIAAIIIGLILYIYFAIALQSIAKKLKYKHPWFAWIPVLNLAMILQLGKFHWAWVFLILGCWIPVIGTIICLALLVLMIISFWRIFEKLKYSGALSLLLLLPVARVIMIGIVAWSKKSKKK